MVQNKYNNMSFYLFIFFFVIWSVGSLVPFVPSLVRGGAMASCGRGAAAALGRATDAL